MAEEILKRCGDKVRVVTRPPHQVVVQEWGGADWKDVGEYHRVSDDYAFTNAYEHAERHARRLAG